ncbi:HTH-like domain-containing protein [Marininema mesophilum]|uniref:HTH-like domain-containing protein n=1 Tax=Marininema mesophilum TaxID=1048340 RepID=A0A1H2UN89_9BACL|nr:IS3 family transposase [Marininema mesophilum]SDW57552.1 HTH-like domain-containing protein [Marininema mesophilum]
MAKRRESNIDEPLKQALIQAYQEMKGIYGYRRMRIHFLRKYNWRINHKRVYRLMKQLELQAVIRRKRPYIYSATYGKKRLPNRLERQFQAERPHQKWVTDVTYISVLGRRMYLSVMLDLFNNEVVSYHLNPHPSLGQVLQTVEWDPEVQETMETHEYQPEMRFFTAGEETLFLLDQQGWMKAQKMLG